MAEEVGVLNLTINDNSKSAAEGLQTLATKLGKVKDNAASFELSNVQTQLKGLVDAVKDNSKAASSIGALLNAVSNYYKTFKSLSKDFKIDTRPLTQLKEAVDGGFNIGNAGSQLEQLRTALSKEWNTENGYNAGFALSAIGEGARAASSANIGTVAKNVGSLADALSKYASSGEQLENIRATLAGDWSPGNASTVSEVLKAIADGAKAVSSSNLSRVSDYISKVAKALDEYAKASEHLKTALGNSQIDDAAQRQKEWMDSGGFASGSSMPLNLQQFGARRGSKKSQGQIQMDLDALAQAAVKDFSVTTGAIQEATSKAEEFRRQVQETGSGSDDGVKQIEVAFADIGRSIETATNDLIRFSGLYEKLNGGYGGAVPEGMMLSTQVRDESKWKPNWRYYNPALGGSRNEDAIREAEEYGSQVGSGIAEGILQARRNVQESTGIIAETINTSLYSSLTTSDFMSIMDSPLAAMRDMYRTTTEAAESYKRGTEAVLPKVQEMSSEQMLLAGNARRAAEGLARVTAVMEELKKPIDYSGFQKFVELAAGVYKKGIGPTADKGFIDLSAIQAFTVPALDENGPFQYASDEVAHYSELLRQAQADLEFWDQKYNETQKRIKYNGTSEELESMLGHAEKGFMSALERVDEYGAALASVNAHVSEYQQNAYGLESVRTFFEIPELRPLLEGLQGVEAQMATIQAISSGTGIGTEEIMRQLTELSGGAIQFGQATEQINAAAQAASDGGLESIKREIKEITEATIPAVSKIELLQTKIENLKQRIEFRRLHLALSGLDPNNDKDPYINSYMLQIGQVNEQIDKLVQKAHEAQDAMRFEGLKAGADNLQRTYGADMVNDLMNNYSEIDLLELKMRGLQQALADDINQNKVDTQQIADRTMAIQRLRDKIEELKSAQENATEETRSSGGAIKTLKASITAMFPTITGLIKRFQSMAKMRAIRYIIRQIAAGISEGMKNVYYYSQAVGTSFAPAMDNAATSLLMMKNSIGAMLAPAVQALIPLLQTVVNWFITGINYVNQFFALLNGQKTWTKAIEYSTEAYKDNTKASKEAAKAAKDLLADWDELNIIQSNSGGGAGAGSKKDDTNYAEMFTEVSEYDDRVKKFLEFVKENFATILGTVLAIKVALKSWKLASVLAKNLPFLSTLASGITLGATIGLTLLMTDLTGKAFTNTGDPAWLIADALTGAVGSTLAKGIATKIAGATAGTIAQGFTLILSGAVNIVNAVSAMEQQKEAEAWWLGALGAIEAGIGVGIVTGSLAAGLVVTLAAATLTVPLLLYAKKQAEYRQMAIDAFKETGENGISTEAYLAAMQTRLNELTEGASLIVDAHLEFAGNSGILQDNLDAIYKMNAVLKSGDTLTQDEAEQFKTAWHTVFEAMNELSTISFDTIYAGLSEAIANGTTELRTQASELRKQTIEIAGIVGGTRGRLEKEMELLLVTITSGTADKDELEQAIARYDEIYKLLADTEDSGIKNLQAALKTGSGFDFTGEEHPVQAAVDFINSISEQDIQPALDTVTQAYDAGVESIEEVMKELKLAYDAKEITKEDYDKFYNVLLGDMDVLKERFEAQKKEIFALQDDAYKAVIDQAWRGYVNAKGQGQGVADAYVKNVLEPILQATEAAGYDTSFYRNILNSSDNPFFEAFKDEDVAKRLAEDRDELYQQVYDEFGTSDVDVVRKVLALEIDAQMEVNGVGEIQSGTDLSSAIINSILGIDGIEYRTALKSISDLMGWSMDDILAQIDLSKFNSVDLEILLETIEDLKKEFNDNNPVNPQDVSEAAENTKKIAEAYESMAQRIRDALQSLDGASVNMTDEGGGGLALHTYIPTKMAATGGFIKSGDLIMANENGNIEMMGRMGTQPVVANNQQIVNGISSGVAQANTGVESRLGAIETLLTRLLQKEIVAKAVPGSSWGAHNQRSEAAYDKVTG